MKEYTFDIMNSNFTTVAKKITVRKYSLCTMVYEWNCNSKWNYKAYWIVILVWFRVQFRGIV